MELGHILSKNGKELEENIGKIGIMKRAARLMHKKKTLLTSLDDLDPKGIVKAAFKGDKVSKKIFREVGETLGEGLVAVIRLLDIKTILIGGGLAAGFDLIIEKMQETLEYNLTPYYLKDMLIKKAELGNDAGIIRRNHRVDRAVCHPHRWGGGPSLCGLDRLGLGGPDHPPFVRPRQN